MICFKGAFGLFFLYVKNFFLQISHICNRTECSYYEERRIRGGSPRYPLKQLYDRKIQKILVLLRGPSVKNNLSHTGHCVVADQGWEELRLERGGLALHSYRFHFWFECVSKGVASPIMHRNRRCPSLLYFHGSCRENRGHMFQNHNLARLKAGLRSTLWWNM